MVWLEYGKLIASWRQNTSDYSKVTQLLQPVWTVMQPMRIQQSSILSLHNIEPVGFLFAVYLVRAHIHPVPPFSQLCRRAVSGLNSFYQAQ
jgi:hypothetical protein